MSKCGVLGQLAHPHYQLLCLWGFLWGRGASKGRTGAFGPLMVVQVMSEIEQITAHCIKMERVKDPRRKHTFVMTDTFILCPPHSHALQQRPSLRGGGGELPAAAGRRGPVEPQWYPFTHACSSWVQTRGKRKNPDDLKSSVYKI